MEAQNVAEVNSLIKLIKSLWVLLRLSTLTEKELIMEYLVVCMNCKKDDECGLYGENCLNDGECNYINNKYSDNNKYSLFKPREDIKHHYKLKKETINMENYKTINKVGTEIRNIDLKNVNYTHPIFALKNDKLYGMIVKQNDPQEWILRIGGDLGAYGYRDTLEECIKAGQERGFTFITP